MHTDPALRVTVELAEGAVPGAGLTRSLATSIEAHLVRQNSEFHNYVPAARQAPEIVLKPCGDAQDFPPGAKHRFTRH